MLLLEPSYSNLEELEKLKEDINQALDSYRSMLSVLPRGIAKEFIHLKFRRKEWELELLSERGEALIQSFCLIEL